MKMKFKAQLAVIAIVLLFIIQVQSQKIYINVGGGYGLTAAPSINYFNEYSTISNGTSQTTTNKIIKGNGSFGKGIQTGATFGYMFNENIGAELGISYLIGFKNIGKSTTIDTNYTTSGEFSSSGKMLRFVPSVVFTCGNGKIKPYMRTGLVIGVVTKFVETSYSNSNLNGVSESEREYKGGTSIGFAGGLGANYKVSNHFGIFAELAMIAQSWAPKKSKQTKYIYNGEDRLSSLLVNQKETEYVESYSTTQNVYPNPSNIDTSVPSKQLKFYLPFSSAGINVGVRLSL